MNGSITMCSRESICKFLNFFGFFVEDCDEIEIQTLRYEKEVNGRMTFW